MAITLDVLPKAIEGQRLHSQPTHGMSTQTLAHNRLVHQLHSVELHRTRGYLIVWRCKGFTFEAHLADEQTFEGCLHCAPCALASSKGREA